MDGSRDGRAVVVGGGIAGLLAARVLAERHPEVKVLDRDGLEPDGESQDRSDPRRGVPQGRHIHTLLPRGRQILEELFPGLTAQLVDAGAPFGDLLGDARLHLGGHRLARADAGLMTVSVSRPYLETCIRERLKELPNVSVGPPTDVLGLVTTPDGQRVRGVRVLRRADGSAEEVLDAALVIDAMGRGSRTPTWLRELGYAQPPQEHVSGDLGYATRHYRLHPEVLDGDWGTLQGPTTACPRGGALARIEGDRWIVTLFGMLGDHPPTDPDGFVDFAGSLSFPDLVHAIRSGEPLDDPVAFRFPASVRHRYEQLARFPDGLLPIGDAVCSLNPIYGQGMTVAALQALALREHVGRHGTAEPHRWLRRVTRVGDAPWGMVVNGDLAFPTVEGHRTATVRLLGAYIARLHAAAAQDQRLAISFGQVMALVDAPTALLRPATVVRVLRGRRPAARRRHPADDARRRGDTRHRPARGGPNVRDVRMLIAALLVPGLVLLTTATVLWLLL
jgi:2-polyprenyl-6-methoxyphenol hydroxylase-like FAD-dependent oxidoreductase